MGNAMDGQRGTARGRNGLIRPLPLLVAKPVRFTAPASVFYGITELVLTGIVSLMLMWQGTYGSANGLVAS